MRVHDLELFAVNARTSQFRLLLIQPVRQSSDAKGRVDVLVEGLDGDIFKRIPMRELELTGDFSGAYSFRYYLELHGQFRLPEGFKPLRVVTVAIPNGKGRKSVRQTFIWQEALAAESAEES